MLSLCKPNVLFEGTNPGFSKMFIILRLTASNPLEAAVLRSSPPVQLYGALVGKSLVHYFSPWSPTRGIFKYLNQDITQKKARSSSFQVQSIK